MIFKNEGGFVTITIKPIPVDADLEQELHREGIDCKEHESEIDARIREAGLAGAEAGRTWKKMFDYPDESPFISMYCKPLSTEELLEVADAAGKLGAKPNQEPMKKYQLLEKAMQDYPAGTKARFKSVPLADHISNGVFTIADLNGDGSTYILTGNHSCVYANGEWAEIVPDKVFVLRSEDGVDLYVGDAFAFAYLDEAEKWKVTVASRTILSDDSIATHLKFFSTKEAAEAWIKEHNKPAVIRLKLEGGEAIVTKDKIRVHLDSHSGRGYCMEATEIEPIYAAYKSLQP